MKLYRNKFEEEVKNNYEKFQEDKLEEGQLHRVKDFLHVYHRTNFYNVQSIIDNGFRAGSGALYGYGLYSTWDLDSQFGNNTKSMASRYGDTVMRFQVNLKGILVFDYNVAKQLYGNKYTLVDQLLDIHKIYKSYDQMPRYWLVLSKLLEDTFQNPQLSAVIFGHALIDNANLKSDFVRLGAYDFNADNPKSRFLKNGLPRVKGIRGAIFQGNNDGAVLLSYHPATLSPKGYIYDEALDYNSPNYTGTSPWQGVFPRDDDWTPLSSLKQNKADIRANNAEWILTNLKGVKEFRIIPEEKMLTYDLAKEFPKNFAWFLMGSKKDLVVFLDLSESTPNIVAQSGIWKKGEWHGGEMGYDVIFKGGKFTPDLVAATFFGKFEFGIFEKGEMNGRWVDGRWGINARWGNSGQWVRGEIETSRGWFQSKLSPPDFYAQLTEFTVDLDDYNSTMPLKEEFTYDSLSDEDQEELYQAFHDAYVKAVGSAWDKSEFDWKAKGWTFFGSVAGGIAVRKQRSGGLKLNATYGNFRGIIQGFQELMQKYNDTPIWGFMTPDLAKQLQKLSKGEFKPAPAAVAKVAVPKIAQAMGQNISQVTNKGTIIVTTPAGQPLEKMFVGNKSYYRWLLDMAADPANAGKIPVPQIVLKPLLHLIKALI